MQRPGALDQVHVSSDPREMAEVASPTIATDHDHSPSHSRSRSSSPHPAADDAESTDRSASPANDTTVAGHHHPANRPRKSSKHIAGHGRIGARTLSSGRNLNKTINLAGAIASKERDEGGPQTARLASNATGPMMSPRHKPGFKRNLTSTALARSTSGSNLAKNTSHTNLHKGTVSTLKHATASAAKLQGSSSTSSMSRPDFHRSQSHPNKLKDVIISAVGTNGHPRQAGVHFEIGDEADETGEMEGVDDGWTDSASPCTTRDNTRTNTRSNSMTSDVRDFKINREEMPFDKLSAIATAVGANISGPRGTTPGGSSAASPHKPTGTTPGSYQEAAAAGLQPPSADAIARKLLQRSQRPTSAPKVSEISVIANGAPPPLEDVYPSLSTSTNGSGSGPRISRFISEHTGSSTSAKLDSQNSAPSTSGPSSDRVDEMDDSNRTRHTPPLGAQFSPFPSEAPSTTTSSGTHTPSAATATAAANRPSRTQQKLWLQRGLSHIEATTQQQAIALGNFQAGGMVALLRQLDKVEKEYRVMRRFHDPIQESIDRLRRYSKRSNNLAGLDRDAGIHINGASAKNPGAATGTGGTSTPVWGQRHRLLNGSRTPAAESFRSSGSNNTLSNSIGSAGNVGSAGISSLPVAGRSLALSPRVDHAPDGEAVHEPAPLDWQTMTLDEIDLATRDMRRHLWELTQPADDDV